VLTFNVMSDTSLLVASVLFGILFLVFAYLAGWLDFMQDDPEEVEKHRRPSTEEAVVAPTRVAGAPGGPPIKRMSDADIAEQEERCADVRQRSLSAAKQIKAHADGTMAAANCREELSAALGALQGICDELDELGPLGVTAMSSLCNVLLETDSLKHLDALQAHGDSSIQRLSTKIFQHVIPRIWIF